MYSKIQIMIYPSFYLGFIQKPLQANRMVEQTSCGMRWCDKGILRYINKKTFVNVEDNFVTYLAELK